MRGASSVTGAKYFGSLRAKVDRSCGGRPRMQCEKRSRFRRRRNADVEVRLLLNDAFIISYNGFVVVL